MRPANIKNKIATTLKEVFNDYPQELASQHLSIILGEYEGNFDCISDKEFLHLVEKYKKEKELDIVVTVNKREESIDTIINQSLTIDSLMEGIDEEEID